ncbi:hypothetical protein JTE90_012929 [Oedothorax gibbosus]|uniref:Uncharacterized protein n=1 Tax=Oedothorax gibbosus TaxID=931172 RepID=A0AAV6UZT5_9ARAC|nr:hypothetical protein JTE90_012929 [Oedothorax gibbosus]
MTCRTLLRVRRSVTSPNAPGKVTHETFYCTPEEKIVWWKRGGEEQYRHGTAEKVVYYTFDKKFNFVFPLVETRSGRL